jgi:DNA (cytosine-5)-methyltransferase 1
MKFIELFAGVGAFRLGLERTGHECVWANEWLERPRSIYARNFGHQPDGRDIRDVSAGDIPDADLLVGGFPCATFSVAGKRTGFSLDDTRGTLAFEMFRLAHEKSIPYLLFENVKGLLNHDGGRTFEIILEVLDGLGYDCQWELLNSENFGVPQHRERVFLIGNLRGKSRPKVFPIGRTGYGNHEKDETKQKRREGLFSNISPTLDAHYYKGGNSRPYVSVKAVVNPSLKVKNQNGRLIKEHDEPSFSLTAQDIHGVVLDDGKKISLRRLTPLECERLQGLPDGWTEFYDDGRRVSDSERYERCGRTITIPVVEAIGRRLHEFY